MAIFRTTDHDEVRAWVEKYGGHPAMVVGTTDEDSEGVLTIAFDDKDPETTRISWQEFFGIFETQKMQFRYEDPPKAGEDPSWAYSFEDRTEPRDTPDETQLPDDVDDVDENMFPSAP